MDGMVFLLRGSAGRTLEAAEGVISRSLTCRFG